MKKKVLSQTNAYIHDLQYEFSTKILTLKYTPDELSHQPESLKIQLHEDNQAGPIIQELEKLIKQKINIYFVDNESIGIQLITQKKTTPPSLHIKAHSYKKEPVQKTADWQAAYLTLSNRHFTLQDTHDKLRATHNNIQNLLHKYLEKEKEGLEHILESYRYEKGNPKEEEEYKTRYYFIDRVKGYIEHVLTQQTLPNDPARNWIFWKNRPTPDKKK